MKKRTVFIQGFSFLILMLVLLQPLSAQKKVFGVLNYDTSVPFGNTKDFSVSQISWRGISAQLRYFLNPKLSAGLYFGLQVFHGDTAKTASIDLKDKFSGAITGNQARSINSVPIMLGVYFHAGKGPGTQAYIGLNTGVFGVLERVDIALFSVDQFVWHFGLAPEIGVILPLGYNFSLTAGVKYNYAFNSGQPLAGQSPNQSYLSMSIGLGYTHYFFSLF